MKRTRRAGIIGTVVGTTAGVAAGVAAERLLSRRPPKPRPDPYRDEPFGRLPADEYRTVLTDEGVPLHVEIVGPADAPLTVMLVHGFCLNSGTFHFQRKELSMQDGVRVVAFDQPGHGRSGRLPRGEYSIDMLGSALRAVIEDTSPQGRVVLVGHSMGAMGIMALADQAPEMFATEGGRVAGVVMLCTSAGKLDTVTFGLPDVLVRFRGPLLPLVSSAGWVTAGMVDRARQASTQLAWLLTRRYGFGSSSPSPTLVSYVERMNSATPTEVVARYLRALYSHDRLLALSALKELAVLVICGEQDLLTPVEHSEAIVQVLPEAELVVVPDAGHALPLEHSEAVNAVLSPFVRRLVP